MRLAASSLQSSLSSPSMYGTLLLLDIIAKV
jgi:hypothetical protein